MKRLILILPMLAACEACSTHQPAQVDPLRLDEVGAILGSVAAVVDSLAGLAATPVACYVTTSSATALRTASEAMVGAEPGVSVVLPAVGVDYSACGEVPEGVDVPAQVEAAVEVVAGLLPTVDLIASRVGGEDACAARAWIAGSLAYAVGVAGPVVEEVGAPDGVIDVPGVTVDLSGCQ